MKIYTHEDIDAKVIVDNAISNIVADAKKTFGSSYDTSLYDVIKDKITQTSSKELQGLLYNFIGGMNVGQIISIKAGEADRIISLLMVNDFYAGGPLWLSFIRGLLKSEDKVEEGTGIANKWKEDADKHRKESTGGDCSMEELAEAILDPEGEMAHKCIPPEGADNTQEGEGSGEGGDGSGGGSGPGKGASTPDGAGTPKMFDPLVLDLNHNGKIDTSNINSGGVYFDIECV